MFSKRVSVGLWMLIVIAATLTPPSGAQVIEDGVLDWIDLRGSLPAGAAIVVERFDAANADLGTGADGGKEKVADIARQMQDQGPGLLAAAMVAELKSLGFADVRLGDGSAASPGSVVIRGEFTLLNPGSRAKRYWAGFGAGKGSVEVEGSVTLAGGETLASFRQKRLTVMGVAGGNYEKKMTSDCQSIGEDIAKFLHAWSTGKPLKK